MNAEKEGTSRRAFLRGMSATLAGMAAAKSAVAEALQELGPPSEN